MNALSVASGIEAATVSWRGLIDVVGVSEIDAFACNVLRYRLKAGRPVYFPDPEDFSGVSREEYEAWLQSRSGGPIPKDTKQLEIRLRFPWLDG